MSGHVLGGPAPRGPGHQDRHGTDASGQVHVDVDDGSRIVSVRIDAMTYALRQAGGLSTALSQALTTALGRLTAAEQERRELVAPEPVRRRERPLVELLRPDEYRVPPRRRAPQDRLTPDGRGFDQLGLQVPGDLGRVWVRIVPPHLVLDIEVDEQWVQDQSSAGRVAAEVMSALRNAYRAAGEASSKRGA